MIENITSIKDMEEVTRGSIEAINQRDFSLDSPAWAHHAPSWTSQMLPLAPDAQRRAFNLSEHITMCEELVKLYPDYRMEALEMSTYLSEESGTANVYIRFKVTGVEPGLVRSNMGINRFKYVDGKWLIVSYRAAMDVTGVPGVE